MRRWWMWGLPVLWVLGMAALQWWKFDHTRYNGLDLGIYTQTVWSLAHGHSFASSIHDPSYLGDHLEPILVPVAWLYRLAETPLTLLFVQTLALGAGLFMLIRYFFQKLPRRWAIGASLVMTINPLLFNAGIYEFHALTLLFPVLVWAFVSYEHRRWWRWMLALLLTVVWREDMPILILGWSVLGMIERRNWRWWLPPMILAPIWFLAAEHIIQIHAVAGYKYLAFYQRLGSNWLQIAESPFRHPIIFLSQLLHPYNIITTLGFAASVGGLCLLRPKRLFVVVLLAFQLFLTAPMPTSVLRLHYIIPYLPFVVWAAVEALDEMRRGSLNWWAKGLAKEFGPLFAAATVVYMLAVIGPFVWPWKNQDGNSAPHAVVAEALAMVHPNDSVLASFSVLPQMGNRANLYSLSYLFLGTRQYSQIPYHLPTQPDVIILDQQQWYEYGFFYRETTVDGKTGYDRFNDLLKNGHYAPVFQKDSWVVYRRNATAPAATPIHPASTDKTFGPIRLTGASAHANGATLRLDLALEAHDTIDAPIDVLVTIKNGRTVLRQQRRVILHGETPAATIPSGTQWTTTMKFQPEKPLSTGAELTLEFERVDGNYRLDRLCSFHPVVNSATPFGSLSLPISIDTSSSSG